MNWKPKRTVPLAKLIGVPNVAALLDQEDLDTICQKVSAGYEADVASRAQWATRKANANKLALQVAEATNFPWPNASNIKFPLVTVAALQFQARAYPALVGGTEVVKSRVVGMDPDGSKTARAQRISTHMSWQCMEQDSGWEEEHDKLFLAGAIAGCAFIKSAYEPGPGRLVSQLVLPVNLVVNYFTRDLADAPRYTQTYFLTANAIRQRELDKRFIEFPKAVEGMTQGVPVQADATQSQNQLTDAKDQRQGIYPQMTDDATPWFTGEQYCWFDLDGDGYEEPYIVTFDVNAKVLRRIVARFLPSQVKFLDGSTMSEYRRQDTEQAVYDIPPGAEVYKITPVKIFTKYGFIPSPDGGFYDLGLGDLAGPINESVNTILNQVVDAGTMANLGAGFLGRAFRGRGGPITFAPGQWHPIDNAGDDIRKSLLPLPTPGPDAVLFQLLGFLVQYAERIVSATEIQVGQGEGQNQKAETTRILNENGARVYTAIYKRFWRSMRDEFRVRYDLNARFLRAEEDYTDLTTGANALIHPDDYQMSSLTVRPAADPYVVSDADAERQATLLVQMANSQPGFNRYKATKRLLNALRVPNQDEVYPPPMMPDPKNPQQQIPAPDVQPPPNPKMLEVQLKQGKLQLDQQRFQRDQIADQVRLLLEAKESQARIDKLQAEAVKITAEAKGANVKPLIELIYAHIEAEGKHKDWLLQRVETINGLLEKMDGEQPRGETGKDAGVGGLAGLGPNQALSPVPKANGGSPPGELAAPGL